MKIHFTGIGGVGMAGLAVLMKARGHEVTGCDVHVSARTRWLEAQGIRVFIGHDPAHVADADLVVVTPAVHPDEPELVAATKGDATFLSREPRTITSSRVRFRGELLADLVNESDSIAVCGTHGKTTTSTWIAKLLLALGEDVTWCIGGETGDFPVAGVGGRGIEEGYVFAHATGMSRLLCSPQRKGDATFLSREKGDHRFLPVLVVEADESDGTLALYRARTLVVNKLEYDHPDHFKTPDAYFACFDTARRQSGDVVESEALSPADPVFDPILAPLPSHNRKNARAAIEVAFRRGHAAAAIAAALPEILSTLPDRRFQRIWPVMEGGEDKRQETRDADEGRETRDARRGDCLVYTDYAHHPTEMACAVEMARKICGGTLRVLFQPHRPSRTKALLNDFPKALAAADELVLCPTYMAFEPPVEGGDIADLYKACRELLNTEAQRHGGPGLYLARSCEEAWEHARNSMKPGDLTLLLGAGDIIRLVPQIQSDLEFVRGVSSRPASPRRIWIGAGTNTWKSDLNLSVEYVKTTGPAGRPGAEIVAAHPGLCPWMAGIPGTVGGWIKMNAGAFGHSFSEVLEAVKIDGEWVPASACGFAYRHSDIKGEIQDYRLRRDPKGDATLQPPPDTYISKRRHFPAGTYGSFFKNPPGDFAGRLLEAAGAKELRVGVAYVWSEHANVIVRGEGTTGSDVLALARLMRNRVFFRFGILLDPEVTGISW